MTPSIWHITWRWLRGPEAIEKPRLLEGCAALFSNHYGHWGESGPNPGQKIALPPSRLQELLKSEESGLACAYHADEIVGYCIVIYFELSDGSSVSWVVQLVVHSAYRAHRVATHLLYSAWGFSGVHAWGLCTPNPLAVRALETATRRPCKKKLITDRSTYLLPELAGRVPYIPDSLELNEHGHPKPVVHTDFYVDHQGVERLKRQAARSDRPWELRTINEGQEWLACTFGDQNPQIDAKRLDQLLRSGDSVWVEAYERMSLDGTHSWHSYTEHEVNFILSTVSLSRNSRILDVGSGDGRHALNLGRRGFSVKGVDIAARLVEHAEQEAISMRENGGEVFFANSDVRHDICANNSYDLALCLYDVIGSSADKDEDLALLKNVYAALRPGGALVLSVMNTDVTLPRLSPKHCPRTLDEMLGVLECLPASNTMERSGEIFEPTLLVYFDGVYHRKEQFSMSGPRLPQEMIVRDKRYSRAELRKLVESAGFISEKIRPVRAGSWHKPECSDEGKELLVIASKPRSMQKVKYSRESPRVWARSGSSVP